MNATRKGEEDLQAVQSSGPAPDLTGVMAPHSSAAAEMQSRHGNGAVAQAVLAGSKTPTVTPPSGGGGLPGDVLSSMEAAFGRSFSDVRVSEGQRVRPGQLALTEGRNIDFAPGHFKPETSEGRFLLAHELTHVVHQQNGGGEAALAKSDGSHAPARPDLESEANDVASRVVAGGGPVQVLGTVAPGEPVALAYEAREHILAAWNDYKGWVWVGDFYIPWAFTVTMADLFHSIAEAEQIAKNDPEQFEAVLSLQVALPIPGRKGADGKESAIDKKIGTDKKRYDPKLSDAYGNIDNLLLVAAVDPAQFRFRSPKGGKRKRYENYSERIQNTIKERYYELAGDNFEHYLNPEQGDLGRSTLEKIKRGKERDEKGKKKHPNLAGTYREYHEEAIVKAVKAGAEGRDLNEALISEGWAAHFLSDAFASGHLRTVRRDGAKHWDEKLPFFYDNMIGYLSEEVAKWIKAHSKNLIYRIPSLKTLLPLVRNKIKDKFKKLPRIGGGQAAYALLSHDYDNYRGVHVIIEGKPMRLMGDTRLDQATMEQATKAMHLSRGEVTQAYTMGVQGTTADDVKLALQKEELYAAEHLIPIIVPDENLEYADKSLQWENRTLAELFGDHNFREAIKRFLELKADDFEGVIAGLGGTERAALENTILKDIKERPVDLLKYIIDWKPTLGTEADELYGVPAPGPLKPAQGAGPR